MPRLEPHRPFRARPAVDPTRWLGIWMVAGVLILLLLPVSHWYLASIGWLPYWLVAVPALALTLSCRQSIAAALRARWARRAAGARRRPGAGARRLATRVRSCYRSADAPRAA